MTDSFTLADLQELAVPAHTQIPVEHARHGDIYTLPNGRQVQIERVDHYDDQPSGEVHVIRWRAGTSTGSLKPMRPGHLINVQRTPRRPTRPRPPPP